MKLDLSRRSMLKAVLLAGCAVAAGVAARPKKQIGIAIRLIKHWHPVESVYYQWSNAVYTDRATDRIVLRGEAMRVFLERMHEYDCPDPLMFQMSGYARHSVMPARQADGWAFAREWYVEPVPMPTAFDKGARVLHG